MNALYITLFVSFVLVILGLVLFVHGVGQRSHDHIDRLALLPLEDDAPRPVAPRPACDEAPPEPRPVNPSPSTEGSSHA